MQVVVKNPAGYPRRTHWEFGTAISCSVLHKIPQAYTQARPGNFVSVGQVPGIHTIEDRSAGIVTHNWPAALP